MVSLTWVATSMRLEPGTALRLWPADVADAQRDAAEIASSTRELAERLTAPLPVSDTAILLGVSKGRITQLTHHPRKRTPAATKP